MPANLENSSGHRIGKCQFSIPKKGNTKECLNYHTIVLFHRLARQCLTFFKLHFNSTWAENFQRYKLYFKRQRNQRSNYQYLLDHRKSKIIPEKYLLLLHWLHQSLWTLLHCWWECKLAQPLWRTVWRFLKKLQIELPYDPAIPLLGIHTEETRIERDTCTPMFIAALFIIARTWKQPRCPSADEWIRKLWYIDTMEYYSAIKKNTFESVLMRWMTLEPIMQSELSQKEKHQYRILMLPWWLRW